MTSLTFKIVLGLYALLLVLSGVGSANAELSDSYKMALYAIQKAESAGADVSMLVVQFNSAMEFVEQAEASEFRSCSSYDSCMIEGESILIRITQDAANLEDEANKSTLEEILVSETYVVTGALTSSLLIVAYYGHWKSAVLRRFLHKQIREKR